MRRFCFLLLLISLLFSGKAFCPTPDSAAGKKSGLPNFLVPKNIQKVLEPFELKKDDLSLEMKLKKLELVILLQNDPPEKDKIQTKIEEIINVERERQKVMVDELFAVRKRLSPEQARAFTQRLIRQILKEQ